MRREKKVYVQGKACQAQNKGSSWELMTGCTFLFPDWVSVGTMRAHRQVTAVSRSCCSSAGKRHVMSAVLQLTGSISRPWAQGSRGYQFPVSRSASLRAGLLEKTGPLPLANEARRSQLCSRAPRHLESSCNSYPQGSLPCCHPRRAL